LFYNFFEIICMIIWIPFHSLEKINVTQTHDPRQFKDSKGFLNNTQYINGYFSLFKNLIF
jgi:hypothetical protein